MKPNLKSEEHAKTYAKIVAKAWDDEAFKKRLLASPVDVLREHGIVVPAGTSVRVEESLRPPEFRDDLILLPLPAKPTSAELSDEQLDGVAGGGGDPWGCKTAPGGSWSTTPTLTPTLPRSRSDDEFTKKR
jgi:hypothetical protein